MSKGVKGLYEEEFKEYPFMQYQINEKFVEVKINEIALIVMDDIVNERGNINHLSEKDLKLYRDFMILLLEIIYISGQIYMKTN